MNTTVKDGNTPEIHENISDNETQRSDEEQEKNWERSLEIFDFSKPLPPKEQGILRIFYNNCNGIEINNTIGEYLKQKRDKVKYNYIQDVEAPTKLDSLIRQMKVWEVDMVNQTELCIGWEKQVPRYIVQQITKNYDKTGCWTVATSKVDTGVTLNLEVLAS